MTDASLGSVACRIKDNRRRCFREFRSSLIMDVVPKRLWTSSVLFAIIITSLIMVSNGSLDGAAAWANIIALPIAIIGVFLTLRGSSDGQPDRRAQDRNDFDRPESPNSGGPGVTQIGFAGRDQINAARDYYGQNPNGR